MGQALSEFIESKSGKLHCNRKDWKICNAIGRYSTISGVSQRMPGFVVEQLKARKVSTRNFHCFQTHLDEMTPVFPRNRHSAAKVIHKILFNWSVIEKCLMDWLGDLHIEAIRW